jgi:hypothetical protein
MMGGLTCFWKEDQIMDKLRDLFNVRLYYILKTGLWDILRDCKLYNQKEL